MGVFLKQHWSWEDETQENFDFISLPWSKNIQHTEIELKYLLSLTPWSCVFVIDSVNFLSNKEANYIPVSLAILMIATKLLSWAKLPLYIANACMIVFSSKKLFE